MCLLPVNNPLTFRTFAVGYYTRKTRDMVASFFTPESFTAGKAYRPSSCTYEQPTERKYHTASTFTTHAVALLSDGRTLALLARLIISPPQMRTCPTSLRSSGRTRRVIGVPRSNKSGKPVAVLEFGEATDSCFFSLLPCLVLNSCGSVQRRVRVTYKT